MQPDKNKPSVALRRLASSPDLLPGHLVAWLPRLRTDKMSNWIKVEKCTVDKPEISNMAIELGISPEAVLGHCIRFWSWCDDHQKNGITTLKDTAQVDRFAQIEGFGMAMVSVGWLKVVDSTIRIVNFDKHLAKSAKNRAAEAKKKSDQRKSVP